MKVNGFQFSDDSIGIESDGHSIDLHNCYDFEGIEYKIAKKRLLLFWKKGKGEFIDPKLPSIIQIEFSGVYLFKARQRDPEMPFTEDDCLQSLGFMWNDLIEEMESGIYPVPMDGCHHLVVDFMSGFAIKIGAEEVMVRTEK